MGLFIRDGKTWKAIDTHLLSDFSALLLKNDANTRIYFKAHAHYQGQLTSAMTFRFVGRYSRKKWWFYNTAWNGNHTAFSVATATMNVVVNAVPSNCLMIYPFDSSSHDVIMRAFTMTALFH